MAGEFQERLYDHERERHHGILSRLPRRKPTVHYGDDGFLEPVVAASQMGLSLSELRAMVARGELSTRDVGGDVLVRPALVTRMAIRTIA